uniref:Oxidized purine nucleoside triphosphate hydrolase n=1 Tax=Triatoma infestans TaxID=30076 RepID=A0A161MKT8_TRIIF
MRILRSSVVLVKKDDQFLLGFNKKGFNKEKWSGFGGVLQPKEDLKMCALRNTKDQCGLTLEKLEKVGKVEVKFAGVQELVQIHVFISDAFSGDVVESKDMRSQWFTIENFPFDNMWQDAKFWLPAIAEGKKVKGFFVYQNEDLIYHDLNTNAFSNKILRARNLSRASFRR